MKVYFIESIECSYRMVSEKKIKLRSYNNKSIIFQQAQKDIVTIQLSF
jgi:hypothetical protein